MTLRDKIYMSVGVSVVDLVRNPVVESSIEKSVRDPICNSLWGSLWRSVGSSISNSTQKKLSTYNFSKKSC
jgi:hypothetical protein